MYLGLITYIGDGLHILHMDHILPSGQCDFRVCIADQVIRCKSKFHCHLHTPYQIPLKTVRDCGSREKYQVYSPLDEI